MWIGTINLRCWVIALLFAGVAAAATAADVALVFVDTPSKTRYATWTVEESRSNLAAAISALFGTQMRKLDRTFAGIEQSAELLKIRKIDLSKPKDRTLSTYAVLADELQCRILMVVQVRKIEQRNAKPGEILGNLARPQSATKVEVYAEIFNAETKALATSGTHRPLEATYAGQYFGTTNRDEIHGDPDTRAIVIRNENRKRMEAAAHAVWAAVRDMAVREIG